MMERIEEVSPLLKARIAGALYLFTIVAGLSAVLLLHDRLAVAVNLVGGVAYMGVTLLLYYIFKPVSQSLSLIAAAFSLVGFVTGALQWKPLGVDSLVFFGVYCLLLAYLIYKSTFLPRFLAVLLIFAGVNWLTFLSPQLAKQMYPYNLIPGLIGEGALTVWLLVVGVNAARWREQALIRRHAGS